MPYGWTGINLEVDLTHWSINKVKADPELIRDYLGGKGLGAKILWDRISPETVQADSPDNLIVLANGLLTGTSVPYANRCVMTFISPATDVYWESVMGGFWPAELKHAGYDNVIISGKSPTPVYLWINDDKVELRDASYLWGKTTHETRELIRQELQNEKVQIACIGPAGENRVHAAAVYCGTGASFSRAGAGTLWGDKKLKAIAVFGTNDVKVANPAKLFELTNNMIARADKQREVRVNGPNSGLRGLNRWETRDVWYGYFNECDYGQLPPDSPLKKEVDKIEEKMEDLLARKFVRQMACYNCVSPCRTAFEYKGGLTFLKCSSMLVFPVYSKYFDYDWALDCYNWCEEMGLDIFSFSRYVAFAIDLYQRGILTKADTEGMHLEFGNPEIFRALMEKIVRREGIGDVLANGTVKAARQIGKGAEDRVYVMKGLEMRLTATMVYFPIFALTAVDDRGWNARVSGETQAWSPRPWTTNVFSTREEKETFIKEGWFQYPKEYEKYILTDFSLDGTDYEPGCQLHAYDMEIFNLADSLGLCTFSNGFSRYSAIGTRARMAELVSSATGVDFDEVELTKIAKRQINLVRAYNRRLGLTEKDDVPPRIYFERNPAPPHQRLTLEVYKKWRGYYYELMGWDKEGTPTKKTLEKVGLGYVWEELKKREIVTEEKILTGLG